MPDEQHWRARGAGFPFESGRQTLPRACASDFRRVCPPARWRRARTRSGAGPIPAPPPTPRECTQFAKWKMLSRPKPSLHSAVEKFLTLRNGSPEMFGKEISRWFWDLDHHENLPWKISAETLRTGLTCSTAITFYKTALVRAIFFLCTVRAKKHISKYEIHLIEIY